MERFVKHSGRFRRERVWLFPVITLTVLLLIILPAQAAPVPLPLIQDGEQQICYWEFVSTREYPGNTFGERGSVTISGNSLSTSVSSSGGEFCSDTVFRTTHTWSELPSVLTPGEILDFTVNASWSVEGDPACSSVTTGIHTAINTGVDSITAQRPRILANMEPSGSVSNSGSWTVYAGSAPGKEITLIAAGDAGGIGGAVHYTYRYVCTVPKPACDATLSLPQNLIPNRDFTPQVSVVDTENKPIKPDKETWYYNDIVSQKTMKWDGKQATVRYDYICPGSDATRTASVTIPAAPSCNATLALPEKMAPNEEFTLILEVLSTDNKPVTPDMETWYYNDMVMTQTMKWDGKQVVVKYDYVCPYETETKTVSITIPPAKTCAATIVLPENMEGGKEFTPRAEVVDMAVGTPVIAMDEKWYLNGALNALPMTWDGKAAEVKYEYICPLDNQVLGAEKEIPPAAGADFILVVGGLAAVAAAGLAAAGLGAATLKGASQKEIPETYILQVERDYLEVKAKFETPLAIAVWKVKSDGSTELASNASISVAIPSDRAGLEASPTSATGSMTCNFSVPYPRECADVPVTVSAAAGAMHQTARVTVRIVPLYELELSYFDPQNRLLQPGGSEVYATASVKATPMPDARTSSDDLAERITLSLKGPNHNLVRLSTADGSQPPYVNSGMLWIPLSVPELPAGTTQQPGKPELVAVFNEGSQSTEAHLPLYILGEIVLGAWVTGKAQTEVLFDNRTDDPHWMVPEIVVYFHDILDDSAPIHPNFDYTLDQASVKFEPDVMTVRDIYAHDQDQYTIVCDLNDTADLEDAFGGNLEQHNGIIKVTITPQADVEKKFSAEIRYQLCPQFELFAAQGGPIESMLESPEREYLGVTLQHREFVADGDDRLPLYIGVCRTDKCIDKSANPENELPPVLWTWKHSLNGSLEDDFTAAPPENAPAEEAPRLLVKSTKPLLYKTGGENKLSLHIEGPLAGNAPAHYRRDLGSFDLQLQPLLPNLKLWVVAGKRRGTSEAWMVAYLDNNPGRRLVGATILLRVKALGEGMLQMPGMSDDYTLYSGADGTEQLDLVYSGINWSNYQQARFSVSAAFLDATGEKESEAVTETISIGDNVKKLLSDLLIRADMLKLNNPYYEMDEFSDILSFSSVREFTRGPFWNISVLLSGAESKRSSKDKKIARSVQFKTDYTCSEFRNRIAEWLITRRHYRSGALHTMETARSMNGIEFDHFTIGGVHNYEALFLSGMDPEADPRGLDPWWKQNWRDRAYLDPDGLITNNWQRYYSTETGAWLSVAMIPASFVAVFTGGGITLPVINVLLTPIIAAYAAVTSGALGSKWEMGTVYAGEEYTWYRRDNHYTARDVFINDWAARQAE